PAKTHEETIDGAGIALGLRGDALDDGKQILRPVAHLAQQGAQSALAPPLLRCLDDGGEDAGRAAAAPGVGVDPKVEPTRSVAGRHSDAYHLRFARIHNRAPCFTDALRFQGGEKIFIDRAMDKVIRPNLRDVPGPDHPSGAVLVMNGYTDIHQRLAEISLE